MSPLTVSVPHAAELLGISRSYAYHLATLNPPELHTIQIGGRRLVPVSWLAKKLGVRSTTILKEITR